MRDDDGSLRHRWPGVTGPQLHCEERPQEVRTEGDSTLLAGIAAGILVGSFVVYLLWKGGAL